MFSTGTVINNNGVHVSIRWNYTSSACYNYKYDPPHQCEVQAVDPNDVMAVPAGQMKPPVVTYKAAFKVGDLVRHRLSGIEKSSFSSFRDQQKHGCLSCEGGSSKIGE